MQGIGFIDEVSDADHDAIIEAASRRLAKIPPPTLTFHTPPSDPKLSPFTKPD
ncbi:MAG: hypothetical protein ACRDRU_24810 [Pseudonocardiaceae bacterium]